MSKIRLTSWALATLAAALLSSQAQTGTPTLSDLHQLTHGGQNAEAYWSPDGKRLIFMTTRPPYGCDQIFIMNRDGSDQHLVSTGKGQTTCGYFLKDNKHIVYSSTHLAGDACPASPTAAKATSGRSTRATTYFLPPIPAKSKSGSPTRPGTTPKPRSTGRRGTWYLLRSPVATSTFGR